VIAGQSELDRATRQTSCPDAATLKIVNADNCPRTG